MLEKSFWLVMIISIVRLSTPIIIGAMGGLLSELSGVMNLCAEGLMTMGAFCAMLGTYYTGNPWIGVLCGILAGGVTGLLHALISVEYGGIQNLSGLGINMFTAGLTVFFLRAIFDASISTSVASLWTTPILKGIPLVGPTLASFSPLTYFSILIIVAVSFLMNKTTLGLRIRATGDDPTVLETAGVDVWKIRYLCVILCGMLVGLAGAYLSLGQLDVFMDGMVMGKGMLAFIAVKMGRYRPWGIVGMAIMFGFFDALQMQLQLNSAVTISPELIQMIPYVAAIIIMAVQPQNIDAPRAIAEPYLKNKYKF